MANSIQDTFHCSVGKEGDGQSAGWRGPSLWPSGHRSLPPPGPPCLLDVDVARVTGAVGGRRGRPANAGVDPARSLCVCGSAQDGVGVGVGVGGSDEFYRAPGCGARLAYACRSMIALWKRMPPQAWQRQQSCQPVLQHPARAPSLTSACRGGAEGWGGQRYSVQPRSVVVVGVVGGMCGW